MGQVSVDDGIAIGSYGMDSHDVQRVIANGMVKNEGGGLGYIHSPTLYDFLQIDDVRSERVC